MSAGQFRIEQGDEQRLVQFGADEAQPLMQRVRGMASIGAAPHRARSAIYWQYGRVSVSTSPSSVAECGTRPIGLTEK